MSNRRKMTIVMVAISALVIEYGLYFHLQVAAASRQHRV